MFRYFKLTYKIFSLSIKYIFMDKNNIESCNKFYDNFLQLGIIPIKIFQWIVNYTYHLYDEENKSLLFEMFYHKIMNQCQTHDISYTKQILNKYNLHIHNLELINSGSIGQVYKGEWKGSVIAVKIQHPDVNETTLYWFSIFKIIFFILKYTNNLKKLNLDWESLQIYFRSQFDFCEEGKNLEKFYKYYNKNDYVIIPKAYFYKKDVLIMDYIESENLDLIEKKYSKYTFFKIVNFFHLLLEDMFENKPYLHGDFHGGNYGIIMNPENSKKFKIVLYDFGLIIPNSTNLSLMFISIPYNSPDLYLRSFLNIFNMDPKFENFIRPLVLQHGKHQNVSFNDILKTVIKNKGDLKISLETIFLITTFLNTEKFRKVSNKNIIDKISILEEFKCFEEHYDNLVSYYFNDDKSFLEDDIRLKNIQGKDNNFSS
jgi:predicted Ser/Thr protein kinase